MQGLTNNQIYCANQAIRALAILSLSAYLGLLDMKSLCTTIGIPLSAIGLKYAGLNETVSQLLPMAIVVTAEVLSDLSSLPKTVATMMSAASSGWVGNQASQLGCNIVSNGIFAFRNKMEKWYIADNNSDFGLIKNSNNSRLFYL